MILIICYYITHKNIPLILLVNTTSRDIKYYAYIPDIWREGKNLTIKNGYIPRFEGYSRYFTDIAHAYFDYVILTMASACALVFTKTFDKNCIKLRVYDQNWLVMVTLKYCWTILMMWTPMNWSNTLSLTVWKFTNDNVAKLKLGLALDKPWQNHTHFHLNRHWKRL